MATYALRDYAGHPSGTLLGMFRARVIPEQALGKKFTAKIEISGETEPHYWDVNDGILRYSGTADSVDGTVKMDRAILMKLFAWQLTMASAVADGMVTISGAGDIQNLPNIIE